MSAVQIARNYADVLVQDDSAEKIVEQMAAVADLFEQSVEFRAALTSPVVTAEQRQKALDIVVEQAGLETKVAHVLKTIVRNERGGLLSNIVKEAQAQLDAKLGRSHVVIETASEWSDSDRSDFEGKLGFSKARFDWAVVPELVGGVRVRVGDKVWDGSVQKQVRNIKSALMG